MLIEKLMDAYRQMEAWSLAQRQDVGWGEAMQCPHCNSTKSKLQSGWLNPTAGTGKAILLCETCGRSRTWSRKPKAVTA